MKKLGLLAGALALASLTGIAVAQLAVNPNQVTQIVPTTDLIQVQPNGQPGVTGRYATARLVGQVGNGLYTTIATAATAGGTSEQTLGTYSVPATFWNYTGRRLHLHAAFHYATNANNKTVKCYFGSSSISSGTLTASNKNGVCDLDVVRTGASTQIVSATMLNDTTPITPLVNASSTETDTAAIVVKVTGTDGSDSAGDIVLDDMVVTAVN